MSIALDTLQSNFQKIEESDRQMTSVWLLIYLLSIVAFILSVGFTVYSLLPIVSTNYPFTSLSDFADSEFISVFAFLGIGLLLSGLINFVVNIVLTYILVNRRNTHFTRQQFLYEDVTVSLKSLAEKKGIDLKVNLYSIQKTGSETKTEETKKDALLWAFLSSFIPFVSWFVNYFLMNNFYNHERREDEFWENINNALKKLGSSLSLPQRIEAIPNRSFSLYLILSIITVGFFGIYWVFILIKDPNVHFKYHVQVENHLISAFESVSN
jgi:hypothetical protein